MHIKCHFICNVCIEHYSSLFVCVFKESYFLLMTDLDNTSFIWVIIEQSYHYRKYCIILCYTLYHNHCCFMSFSYISGHQTFKLSSFLCTKKGIRSLMFASLTCCDTLCFHISVLLFWVMGFVLFWGFCCCWVFFGGVGVVVVVVVAI